MKRIMFLATLTTLLVASCADDNPPQQECPPKLVTPELYVSVNNNNTESPLTGILDIYPCQPNSAIYFGNYVNGALSSFFAHYTVNDGAFTQGSGNPVLSLPVGSYNLVYWGTPKYAEPIYAYPAIKEPASTLGNDMSTQQFGLFKMPTDTTYYPVFDMAHAVTTVKIGSDKLTASLQRAVAGLKVTIKNKNNAILSSSIDSMWVHVTKITMGLNFYTAKASPQVGTVAFPLVRSIDGTEMSNATVMLFPSVGKPLFKLFIKLKDGTIKTFQQTLNTSMSSNTRLTLTLTLGDIFSEESSGSFTIDNWEEETQEIDVPVIG